MDIPIDCSAYGIRLELVQLSMKPAKYRVVNVVHKNTFAIGILDLMM